MFCRSDRSDKKRLFGFFEEKGRAATPGIVLCLTIATIGLVGATAMAGAVGAGGLGDLALRYGYQQWDLPVMFVTVVILICLVQLLQSLGNWTAKKLKKNA